MLKEIISVTHNTEEAISLKSELLLWREYLKNLKSLDYRVT